LGYQKDPKSKPDGENCHDGKQISNHIYNFCTTIAVKLVEMVPSGTGLSRSASTIVKTFYTSRRNSDMKFNLKHVTEEFVYKELCRPVWKPSSTIKVGFYLKHLLIKLKFAVASDQALLKSNFIWNIY